MDWRTRKIPQKTPCLVQEYLLVAFWKAFAIYNMNPFLGMKRLLPSHFVPRGCDSPLVPFPRAQNDIVPLKFYPKSQMIKHPSFIRHSQFESCQIL